MNSPPGIAVVGGGPAGLAAAIALAQEGLPATIFEAAIPPIDKACGEGLLPDCLAALRKLGVVLPPEAGFPFAGIQFSDPQSTVAATFPAGHALGVRRTSLHSAMVARAIELGVDLRWGTRLPEGEFNLIIGADGGQSATRRQAGLDTPGTLRQRFGFRQHFYVAPWSRFMEVHWTRHAQAYVTPISPTEIGLAVVSRSPHLRVRESLANFPDLQARLGHAAASSIERGSLSVTRTLTAVQSDGVVLVGDASGSVDVITGEGLGLAFRQALALAQSIRAGDLQQYTRAHRRIARRPRLMAHLLLTMDAHPNLCRPALATLSAWPSLFARLLAFHVGS